MAFCVLFVSCSGSDKLWAVSNLSPDFLFLYFYFWFVVFLFMLIHFDCHFDCNYYYFLSPCMLVPFSPSFGMFLFHLYFLLCHCALFWFHQCGMLFLLFLLALCGCKFHFHCSYVYHFHFHCYFLLFPCFTIY